MYINTRYLVYIYFVYIYRQSLTIEGFGYFMERMTYILCVAKIASFFAILFGR